MSDRTTGGYPSGNKPVSELKPPPSNICKPGKPANDLREALLELCDKVERKDAAWADLHGAEGHPFVSTQKIRDLIAEHSALLVTPRIAPGVPRWFGYEER